MTSHPTPSHPTPAHPTPAHPTPAHPTPTQPTPEPTLRLSDADREAVADRIRRAAAEGRLTLDEADERQRAAYAARVAPDLDPLTADLPAPPAPASPGRHQRGPLTARARRLLAVHAAIAVALVGLLLARWMLGPVGVGPGPFGPGRFGPGGPGAFFPVWPMLLIAVSLLVHRRRAAREPLAA